MKRLKFIDTLKVRVDDVSDKKTVEESLAYS